MASSPDLLLRLLGPSRGPLPAACLLAALAGCGATKPPEPATAETAAHGSEPAEPADEAKEEPAAKPAAKTDSGRESVPDDYQLTEVDCQELGKQFASVTRSDLRAELSPKLAAKTREKAEADIEKVADKRGDDFAGGCSKSVGKTVDPKSLKCAMGAPTAKAFDVCMNGPPPAK